MRLLVTGGAGFIGSNHELYVPSYRSDWRIKVIDAPTYAGKIKSHESLEECRFNFVKSEYARI